MRSLTLVRNAAGALAVILATGALGAVPAARAASAAPWFGHGVLKGKPVGKPPAAVAGGFRREAPFIRHLYRGFLGREPSGDEVRSWQKVLGERAGATRVIQYFMESDEYFIRQIYLGLLRREPDASGMETYSRMLREGMSREDVVESLLESEEFGRLMR